MLALIPARGGSKGLPHKNIKLLNGKPLIAYAIEAALASKSITKVIISTDDEAIASVGKKYGAEIPFMRPSDLAADESPAIDAYIFTIEKLMAQNGEIINEFVVLLPTSPLRTSSDIDLAIEIFRNRNADSVISCCEATHPPSWAKRINNKGALSNYFNEKTNNSNRQELEKAYMPNGAIYVFKYKLLKTKHTYYSDETYGYLMPPERSIDIDTAYHFTLAELYIKYIINGTF